MDRPTHARVLVPGPVVFAAWFGLAALLHRLLPLSMREAWSRDAALFLCTALALVFLAAGALDLVRSRTALWPYHATTTLRTGGAFRVSRNPIYLGMALAVAALGLWLGWIWPIALLPFAAWTVTLLAISREEAYLASLFGESYKAYRDRTPRWF